MEQCSHKITEDYIDVNTDNSIQIFFCELCNKTCTFEEYVKQIMQDISGSIIQTNK